jgi:hypothetical protein
VLRVLGLAGEAHFVNFHRVLGRAMWSPRVAARVLLGMLVHAFVPDGLIVLGIDDTSERRRGTCIAATTPILLGLFSLVRLLANTLVCNGSLPMRQAAWYTKSIPTFSDALAAVWAHWSRAIGLAVSRCEGDIIKVPRSVFRRLHEAACYAA